MEIIPPTQEIVSSSVPTNPWIESHDFSQLHQRPILGILHNPKSGRNKRKSNCVKTLRSQFSNIPYHEVQTPNDITIALENLASLHTQILVINAGDGTVHAVLTALLDRNIFPQLPLLAIFPSGTTNLIAEDVGIHGAPEQTLPKLLSWVPGKGPDPSIIHRPVLKVHVTPEQSPLYGMFFGAGAITLGNQAYEKNKETLGRLGRLGEGWILTQVLFGLITGQRQYVRPIPITITNNGGTATHREYSALLATTMERLFFGFRPYWGEEPHPIHYTAINGAPKHLLRTLPSLLFGRTHPLGTPENGYHSHNSTQLQLNMKDDVVLDGEIYKPNPELGPITIQSSGPVSFLRW